MQSVILVTRATGNVDRRVVVQLLRAGAAVRALTRNPENAGLPDDVVRTDLSVPDAPGACLEGIEAVFQVWSFFMAEAAPALLNAVTKHMRRLVYLSSEGAGDDLEQQTDTITARIAKVAA